MPAEFFTSSNPASLKLANRKYTGTGFITADDMKKNDMGKFGMYSYLLFGKRPVVTVWTGRE